MGKSEQEAPAGAGRGRSRRASRTVVALVTTAVLAGPFADGGQTAPSGVPPCSIPGQITPHPVDWYSIKIPFFPRGSQVVTDYAVEPLTPERLYITNGEVVMRSTDSGCHWAQSYALPQGSAGEFGTSNSRILEIEVSAPGAVYLPVQQESPARRPHVVMTKDAGQSWAVVDGPLLNSVVGTIRDFDASGNAAAAAMLVDVEYSQAGALTVEGQQVLFTTSTAGAVWEPKHFTDNSVAVGAAGVGVGVGLGDDVQHISMSAVRPNEVWLYGEDGVFVSDGQNLNPVDLPPVGVLDLALDGSSVVAYGKGSPGAHISFDRGASFVPVPMGFTVDSADVITGPAVALSAFGRVFFQLLLPGQSAQTLDLSPLDGRPISDVQFAVQTNIFEDPLIFGRSRDTIEVKYQRSGEPVKPVTSDIVAPPPNVKEQFLVPASTRVRMRPGATRTIPYELGLPAAITPLDVYFMIDISGSMQNTINGIRSAMQDIVDELAGSKIDVQFGVGAFRAYNDPPAYDRVRDIGLAGSGLSDALNSLRASGGGAETQMAALLESVTGEGRNGIAPDLNMHFRPGSLRVAIEVTDEPISQGGSHPSYLEVIDALVEHDVKQVGLAIQDPPLLNEPNYDNPGEPASTLQKVATGSKAIAPAGGVDCTGDGEPEIPEGGPIVCLISPQRADDAGLMAGAIVSVLEAIQDIQDLSVSVTPAVETSGSSRVVDSVDPSVFPRVDLKEPSKHNFELTVRCPRVVHKTRYPLVVQVSQRGAPLGVATASVVCVPRPEPPEPNPLLQVFTPIAAIVPPFPRPPDPIPEPNPNPQPNPQQNPQAGFAAQEQQQPQVALAQERGPAPSVEEETASDEYLATARDQESPVPPVAFIFAVAGITSAYAYSVMTRSRIRTAQARNRRRRRY